MSAEMSDASAQLTIRTKRDELLARKIEVDEKLAALRIDIDEAKGLAWSEGKFMPPRQLADLKRDLAFYQRESQRLQFELRGDRKAHHAVKDQKGALYLQEFFMVARARLPKEQFAAIAKEAEGLLAKSTELHQAETNG